jgi:predicted peroxiredoxin
MPDAPKEVSDAVMKRMEEMELPSVEDLFVMLIAEGATVLACPLNMPLFRMEDADLVDGVRVADPATYYKDVVL